MQNKFLRKECGTRWKPQPSSDLAWFYARCKQTFLTPNSAYELNLPSEVLAPFHVTNPSPHPQPSEFDAIADQVQHLLRESLRRFVTAQFNNVGNNRVLCGIIAGVICCLFGALVPILYNFLHSHSRWTRLYALPGLWLGLTLLVSSVNGICLGVYIFGDLRQLKKFELSRPPISKPQLLHTALQSPLSATGPILPLAHPPTILPPPPVYASSSLRHSSSTLSSGRHSSSSDLSLAESECVIHISPAYYDPDPIEGPAMTPISPDSSSMAKPFSHFDDDDDNEDLFVPTATFIHAYEHSSQNSAPESRLSQDHQSLFDFDALPPKPPHPKASRRISYAKPVIMGNPHVFVIEPEAQPLPDTGLSLKGFIRRIQLRCNVNKWLVFTSNGNGESPNASEEKITSPRASRGRLALSREIIGLSLFRKSSARRSHSKAIQNGKSCTSVWISSHSRPQPGRCSWAMGNCRTLNRHCFFDFLDRIGVSPCHSCAPDLNSFSTLSCTHIHSW